MYRSHIFVCTCLIACFALLGFPAPLSADDTGLVGSVAIEHKDGPDMAILEAIAGKLKMPLTVIHAPFKRRLQLMRSGEIDLMPGLLRNAVRESFIHYLSPPYKNRSDTVFFVRTGEASRVLQYEDLQSLRIGTTIGSTYFPRFDQDAHLAKEAVSGGISNFRKLLLERIDAVVYPESAGIDLIYKMGIEDRVAMAVYRFSERKDVYLGISRRSHLMDDIETVAAIVRSMIESGEIRQILVRYYIRNNLPVPAM